LLRTALTTAGAAAERVKELQIVQADLASDDGWDDAVRDCSHVLHVASPLGGDGASFEQLVGPARDGTLRVLRACVKHGVRRVVVTSSCAACSPREGTNVAHTEAVWTDPDDPALNAYRKSKAVAEKAVWEFVESDESGELEVVTVLPAAVLGPTLLKEGLGSVQLVSRMLTGEMPRIPNMGFQFVDVRDVAAMHVAAALDVPAAANQRFIAASSWHHLDEIAALLRQRLSPEEATHVPTGRMPSFVIRMASWFKADLRSVTPYLDKPKPTEEQMFSSQKARDVLAWQETAFETMVLDCAKSILQ
jgi:dihydroflavonol-4-reductase